MRDKGPASTPPGRRLAALVALLLAVGTLVVHAGHLDEVGLTWDEPPYLESMSRIQTWTAGLVNGPDRAARLRAERIREVWDWDAYHNPHPPFYKEVMAATEAVFGRWLGRMAGARLASLLWLSLLVGAVTWVGTRTWGLRAGAAAGLCVATMPRLVGHGHIAATDMPLTVLFFLGAVGFVLLLRSGRRGWGLVGAAALGLAMGTKFTGYLLPLPLAAWALFYRPPLRRVAIAVGLGAAGLAVATAVNPLAWHDPIGYSADLFRESLSREGTIPIATMYGGRVYDFVLPWHHAVVMTAITVPLGTLVLGAWGGVRGLRAWRDEPLVGLALTVIAFFWGLLALPSSPNHDGVRLFLPLFPFLALLSGRGFDDLARRLGPTLRRILWDSPGGRRRAPALATLALGVLFLGPAAGGTLDATPYYLSYYGEAIGGLRGAVGRGMERTYWYDALTPRFLEAVNRTVPGGATLATFPQRDHFLWLQDYGQLRADIEIAGELPSPYLLQYARSSLFDSLQWGLYREVTPMLSVRVDGVTLAALYRWSDGDPDASREGRIQEGAETGSNPCPEHSAGSGLPATREVGGGR